MTVDTTISSVRFTNFKAFKQFSFTLRNMNILVGPNNSGKSTILGAFRALESSMKIARTKSPEWLSVSDKKLFGYRIPPDSIPISLENVHTNYQDIISTVDFRIANGNRLILYFSAEQGCYLLPISTKHIRRPTEFRKEFPFTIGVVPVLGPLEHNEDLVEIETVKRALQTHRASRHFRNFWWYFKDDFEFFSEMIRKTWPGMAVQPPERTDILSKNLQMFCSEDRISRELYWAGFGFQVWCQLLTHICRARHNSILIVDEPEIYLHPDVQRQLLAILRDITPDILLATHSTEIMTEADPSEILLIDKKRSTAKRIKSGPEVQLAIDSVGSMQNITLTRLARNRRVLFVEGDRDIKVIMRFARILGKQELSSSTDITWIESGGFSFTERVQSVVWGVQKTLGQPITFAAIFDRDYWCEDYIRDIEASLQENLSFVHFHKQKEIENYFLVPAALDRAIMREVEDRIRRGGKSKEEVESSESILKRLTDRCHDELFGQYLSKYTDYHRHTGLDTSTLVSGFMEDFRNKWNNLQTRMEIVDGKDVIRNFRAEVQRRWQVNLTDARIISCFKPQDVAPDIFDLVAKLDSFRIAGNK